MHTSTSNGPHISSQPTQFTLIIQRGDDVVEIGYFGKEENATNALQEMTRTIMWTCPESYRRGEVEVVLIHPTERY